MIPAQRDPHADEPTPATDTTDYLAEAQRAELHLDLTDDVVRDLAMHAVHPDPD